MKNVFSLSLPSLISISNICFLLLYEIYFFFSFSSLLIMSYSSYLFSFLLFSFIFFCSLFFALVIMSYSSYLLPPLLFYSPLFSTFFSSILYYSLIFFHFSLFSLISPTSFFFIIQYVAEQLRHLDTTIILSVMRARADSQKAPWVKTIM